MMKRVSAIARPHPCEPREARSEPRAASREKREARSQKPEAGSWKLEAGNANENSSSPRVFSGLSVCPGGEDPAMHPLCQLCGKRPATTHLTELEPEGDRRELHLCSACIQSLGVQLESGPPSIATLLAKTTSESEVEGDADDDEGEASGETSAEAEPDESCPVCGLEFSEYANNNLFGCANCYLAFGERIEALLKRYHGATRHIGRAPRKAPSTAAVASAPKQRGSERRKLETSLKEAVAKERYEEAATLRDQLRKLEARRADKPPGSDKPDGAAP
jgi:protein arginine kinase activator